MGNEITSVPVVFLDRDGVINQQAPPHCYITKWEDFSFLTGVPEAISKLNKSGYKVIIVTNQRGVARGMMTMHDVEILHEKMRSALEKVGAHIDAIYVCPHEEGQCDCRKPKIGLFLQAEKHFTIDKAHSWMIGDSQSDIEAGNNYGVQSILTNDLLTSVNQIINETIEEKT